MFLSHGFDASVATKKALALAYQTVQQQSGALSFMNSFWVMSLLVSILIPLPFIMRRPKRGEAQPSAVH